MKKRLCTVIILLSICISAFSQTAQVNAKWKANEKKTYHVTYNKYSLQQNDSILTESHELDIEINVIKKDANGYLLSCIYKNIQCPTFLANSIYEKTIKVAEGLTITYKTDKNGSFSQIAEKEKVKRTTLERFNDVLNSDSLLSFANKMSGNIISQKMEESFDNGAFEISGMGEVRLLHDYLGTVYNTKAKNPTIKKACSPITDNPLKCIGEITVKKQGGNLLFNENDSIDNNALTEDMVQMSISIMKSVGQMAGKTLTEKELADGKAGLKERLKEELPLYTKTSTKAEIEEKTGWLNTAHQEVTISIKGQNAVSITDIKRK